MITNDEWKWIEKELVREWRKGFYSAVAALIAGMAFAWALRRLSGY